MKKKNTKLVIFLLGAIILMVIVVSVACKALGNTASEMNNLIMGGIPVQEASIRDLSSVIYTNGTIASQHKVSVTTELTGQVKELYVQLGDYVEAGTPLLVMDDTELRSKIAELEKQLSDQELLEAKQKEINQRNLDYAKEEQTQLLNEAQKATDTARNHSASAAAALETAKNNYNNYMASGITDNNMVMELSATIKEAQTAFDAAQAALNEAENAYQSTFRSTSQQVQAAQDTIDTQGVGTETDNTASATLADLYSQLEKITITAPQSGIITSLNISTGSMVTNGDLMVIEDNKNLKLSVSIQETDILKLSEGMHAVIKSDALKDTEINGTVQKVINFASASNSGSLSETEGMGSSSYSAQIIIEGETPLLLGMNAKAEIVLTEKKDALCVAYDSIFTEDDQQYIYLAVEDDSEKGMTHKVKKVPVTTGDEGDYYTEISSDSVKEGDLVISYPDMVSEGEFIIIENDGEDGIENIAE